MEAVSTATADPEATPGWARLAPGDTVSFRVAACAPTCTAVWRVFESPPGPPWPNRGEALMEANRSDTRVVRAARNEALFREVNERLENLAHTFEQVAGPGTSFACECADLDCLKQVAMSVGEYERVRSHPNQFVVLP